MPKPRIMYIENKSAQPPGQSGKIAQKGDAMKTAKRKKTPADAGIRKTLEKMFAAWSDLDPAQAAPFYAKDPGLGFFDLAPMKNTRSTGSAAEHPQDPSTYR